MKTYMALTLAMVMLCVGFPLAAAEESIVMDDSAYEFEAPSPIPYAPQPTPFVSLQHGASGEGVKQVQTRLTELGYYHGKISGDFLDGTHSGIRAFQKKNGLAVNGKVTATTWNALMNPEAIGKDGLTHPPEGWLPSYLEEDASAEPDALTPPATPIPVSSYVYTRKLEYGCQGDDVRMLQQRLRDLGYFSAAKEITGNYYAHTRDAVRAFQKHNGLKVDGVAGTETQSMLWDDSMALDARSEPRPAPTPEPLRYLLKVDVTNQVTSAYTFDEYGEYTVLVRQMICSTGTKANPTPLKTTQSKGKRARWGYFPEWGSHAQYLTRIDSKNAFHSVLYSEPDPMKLVVGAYNALGKRASHGCVRLLVADAKWIYDNCPSGTTITVYEGESDPELTQMLKPPPLDKRTMLPQTTPEPTAPPVWDPNAPPPPYRLLNKGATGADVWWLQTKLTTLGYYHGTVSGGYYEGTIAAVKAFQRAAGLKADGVAGSATLKTLYENPAYASPIDLSESSEPSGDWIPAPTIEPPPDGSTWLTPPPPPSSTPSPIGGGMG